MWCRLRRVSGRVSTYVLRFQEFEGFTFAFFMFRTIFAPRVFVVELKA